MYELFACQAFVYGKLSQAFTGPKVYELPAPSSAAHPYVVYQIDPDADAITGNRHRVMTPFDVVVRVVGKGSPAGLQAHIGTIQSALDRTGGENGYGVIEDCRRVGLMKLPPVYEGGSNVPTQNIGVLFRILVSRPRE